MKSSVVVMGIIMAFAYAVVGVLLIVFPESNFSKMILPSAKWSYALGLMLIIYGFFRAWRTYQKFKEDERDK